MFDPFKWAFKRSYIVALCDGCQMTGKNVEWSSVCSRKEMKVKLRKETIIWFMTRDKLWLYNKETI